MTASAEALTNETEAAEEGVTMADSGIRRGAAAMQ